MVHSGNADFRLWLSVDALIGKRPVIDPDVTACRREGSILRIGPRTRANRSRSLFAPLADRPHAR